MRSTIAWALPAARRHACHFACGHLSHSCTPCIHASSLHPHRLGLPNERARAAPSIRPSQTDSLDTMSHACAQTHTPAHRQDSLCALFEYLQHIDITRRIMLAQRSCYCLYFPCFHTCSAFPPASSLCHPYKCLPSTQQMRQGTNTVFSLPALIALGNPMLAPLPQTPHPQACWMRRSTALLAWPRAAPWTVPAMTTRSGTRTPAPSATPSASRSTSRR